MSDSPRVWVACLASYNSGRLHGGWVEIDQDADEIGAAIADVLKDSPIPNAEEHAIHAYENCAGLNLGEHPSADDLATIGRLLAEHDSDLVGAVLGYCGTNYMDHAIESLESAVIVESLADWAAELFDGSVPSDLPTIIASNIDWQAIADELTMSDYRAEKLGPDRWAVWSVL